MRSNSTKRPTSKSEVLPCVHCRKRRGWQTGGLCTRCYADPEILKLFGIVKQLRGSAEERFWLKVDKSGDCWLWTASVGYGGYGKFVPGRKLFVPAHRFSYQLHFGPIPDGLLVCHDCDANYPVGDISYRRCVRPDHLFLGTHKDNSQDAIQKNRLATGERAGPAKLTTSQVRIILSLKDREAQQITAERFGISQSHVSELQRGFHWPELEGVKTELPDGMILSPGFVPRKPRLTADQVREIRKQLGKRPRQNIADDFGVTVSGIDHIAADHSWKNVV